MRQTTLEQANTVLLTSRILSQVTEARLKYKRVDFLKRQTILQWPTWSSSSRNSHSYRRATKTGQTTLEQAKTVLLTGVIESYQSKAEV